MATPRGALENPPASALEPYKRHPQSRAPRDELDVRVRSLTAERQRPVPEYRTNGPMQLDALMAELIGTLAELFEPPTYEDYAWLRSQGESTEAAANRVGISENTQRQYEVRYRAAREEAST